MYFHDTRERDDKKGNARYAMDAPTVKATWVGSVGVEIARILRGALAAR